MVKKYKTIKFEDIKAEFLKDPEIKRGYDALAPEFELARALIKKRIESGMTQVDLARKAKTKQSAISRLESGQSNPSFLFLQKIAEALGGELKVLIV